MSTHAMNETNVAAQERATSSEKEWMARSSCGPDSAGTPGRHRGDYVTRHCARSPTGCRIGVFRAAAISFDCPDRWPGSRHRRVRRG